MLSRRIIRLGIPNIWARVAPAVTTASWAALCLKPPDAGGVRSLDNPNLTISCRQQCSCPLDDLGINERSSRPQLPVGKPGIDIAHMDHVLEYRLLIAKEEALSNQRIDHRTPCVGITDDRAVVQMPYLMGLIADAYLDPCVLGLRVNVQQ
jgi:hypothetical protein